MNKTTQSVESATGAFHIEDVFPTIDGGRFPVKRIVGEPVEVWADIYRDGHEVIAAALIWRREVDREWRREPMTMDSNDRWSGSVVPDAPGRYVYAIEAWTDEFATWRHGFELKQKAGTDQEVDATAILAAYLQRWSIEVTFEEARAHLGLETQRQWTTRAVGRTTRASSAPSAWWS